MQSFAAIISILTAAVMASPVAVEQPRDIVLNPTTIVLPTIALPTLTLPGATIPTAVTIPAYSTTLVFPSVCPTSLVISEPGATLALPSISTFTKTVTVTVKG